MDREDTSLAFALLTGFVDEDGQGLPHNFVLDP